jgi:hypothetical protein
VTIGQAVAIVAILAQMYGTPQLACIVEHESDYDVMAQNGIHEGLVQWSPSTREWLAGKAAEDPLWLHGGIAQGPVQDVALCAWAVHNGYGSHWATFAACGGEG